MIGATADPTFSSRVAARLREDRPDLDVGVLHKLEGGHSGVTYAVETSDGPLVVKAVPEGQRAIGRHDMLRQARIIKALSATDVPVPTVVASDDVSPAWFAMTRVAGESLEPVLDEPAVEPAVAAARMRAAAQVLPRLHRVPIDVVPDHDGPLTPADELSRWAQTMHAVPEELVGGGKALRDALASCVPQGMAPTLVHGDYRLGNLISQGRTPVALIDWEIWSVGDPRVELGWFLVFADGSNFPGVGRDVPGLPSDDEIVDIYAGTGHSLTDLTWFKALGRFKMAAIMGHNLRRHREGRHHDPDQEKLPATISQLINSGLSLLE